MRKEFIEMSMMMEAVINDKSYGNVKENDNI